MNASVQDRGTVSGSLAAAKGTVAAIGWLVYDVPTMAGLDVAAGPLSLVRDVIAKGLKGGPGG